MPVYRNTLVKIVMILLIAVPGLISCNPAEEKEEMTAERSGIAKVSFTSSDPELKRAWEWAKKTALSYVREGDAVGPWYEAALPGRDAFCMRDVSHQSTGAAVLGLDEYTKNMLFRFAENISESKDWCSYWEINKDNLPAPVDYKNDKDFWYNLPANFDVIDACFRMYLWSGDTSYVRDTVFLNFYEKSLTDYVGRWDLGADRIMSRKRIMNLPEGATSENHHYYDNRGIPGYFEGAGGMMQMGIDLLAAQYTAYKWYHYRLIAPAQGESQWLREANKIDSIIRSILWDPELSAFKSILYEDGSFDYSVSSQKQDFSHYLLHYNALIQDDQKMINSILDNYSNNKDGLIIEIASHMPDIFFRYGRPDDGIYMLRHLTDSNTYRREYPENPFAVVGTFITGLMGINADATENYISSFSGFENPEDWARVNDLPVLGKQITLLHQGRHTSILINQSEDTIYWQPYLQGVQDYWYINNEKTRYSGQANEWYGIEVSSWYVSVRPGETVSISAFPNKQSYEE